MDPTIGLEDMARPEDIVKDMEIVDCPLDIIPAEDFDNDLQFINILNFESILVDRGCHTSSEILDWLAGWQAGWLAVYFLELNV